LGYSSISGYLKIWDLKSSVVQLNHRLTNNYVTSMCFNSDSSILTAGTFKGEILNFNIPTMSKSNAKLQLNSKINYVKYSPFYSNYIAACALDGSVKIIDTTTGNVINNFVGYHQGEATGICDSPINKLFLSSVGIDNKINFYDIQAKKHIKTINTNTPLTSVSFNIDGQTIAVGNINGGILIYDLRNSTAPKQIITEHNTTINHLEFSIKLSKSSNLNTSGVLNSSRVDLNSSRVNQSFNTQEANQQIQMQNQLNNSRFRNNNDSGKILVDSKINVDTSKIKISDTKVANDVENMKENNMKYSELGNNPKIYDKKKREADYSQGKF
jgi:WD40 repeat protein